MNLNVIDPAVITALRNADYSDTQISEMSALELFEAWCLWEGLMGSFPQSIWRIVRQLQHQETLAREAELLRTHRPVDQAVFLQKIKKDEGRFKVGSVTCYREDLDKTSWFIAGNHVGTSLGRVGENKGFYLPLA